MAGRDININVQYNNYTCRDVKSVAKAKLVLKTTAIEDDILPEESVLHQGWACADIVSCCREFLGAENSGRSSGSGSLALYT